MAGNYVSEHGFEINAELKHNRFDNMLRGSKFFGSRTIESEA